MTQQLINIGSSPNDGTGDPLRTAGSKINDNFTELYARSRPISFFFTTTPTSSEVLALWTTCETMSFADDFAGSVGDCETNPTGSFVMDVQKNGSSIGTITISTSGTFTFVTTGSTVSFVSGDQLKIVAPASADATIANVSITLKGVL